jgi:protoporphyrin/coproporphyrin ferrochelatase
MFLHTAPIMPSPIENPPYDALLIVGFGGPEGPDDVMPFLENVLRGRNVPRERMLEVAEHYRRFGGVSPINRQVRDLIAALQPALDQAGIHLPIYWGNRNWHPFLADPVRTMMSRGVNRPLALVLSAYSSYSSCRQYRENIADAFHDAGVDAPTVDKIRVWYNHPGWIAVNAERVADGLSRIALSNRQSAHLVFTAHSIPKSMADRCDYARQLAESSRLVAERLGVPASRWHLVYQSRSGRPQDPWLQPDVVDHLRAMGANGVRDVIVHPIGFLSDHIEVLYDLDEEAVHACKEIGVNMIRSATVGSHPTFVAMLVDLISERLSARSIRPAIGEFGPNPDICPLNCCPAPSRPPPDPNAAHPQQS